MNADQIKQQIAKLIRVAESGEQWADICALAAQYLALTGKQLSMGDLR